MVEKCKLVVTLDNFKMKNECCVKENRSSRDGEIERSWELPITKKTVANYFCNQIERIERDYGSLAKQHVRLILVIL